MQDEERIKKEFEQLMVRHGKIVEFLCRRASYGREVICQELVQECYVALLRHLMERRVEGMEKGERAWVSMQCRSAIDSYRRKRKRADIVSVHDGMEELLTATHEVTGLTVDELAASLEGAERRCFLLMAEGLSDEELERELGLKHRSVIQMRHNIRKKLEQNIKQ